MDDLEAAVLTHGSLLGAAAAQVAHLATTADDVYVGVLPLNHVGGITCTVTAALLTCSTVVLEPAFAPAAGSCRSKAPRPSCPVAGSPPATWPCLSPTGT